MAFIDPKKLLNSSSGNGGSALVAQPKMFLVPVKNTEYKQTVDLSEQIQENDLSDPEQQVLEDIKVIREKVVKIEDILKKTIKINVKKIQLSRKEDENKKRKAQEDKLEKKDKKRIGMPKIPIPGMSFIDRIKQFLGTVFTGFLVMQIFKLLPKLMAFLDYVKPVTAFIEDFVKGMFDKFVFAIDFGYKIVDGAQSKVKELFGDDGEKKFSEFTSTFTKFMNLAIIAGMATMGGQDPLRDRRFQGPQRRGFDRSGRRVSAGAQQRYRRRFGDQRYGERFGNRNLRRLKGQSPRPARGLDQRLVQRGVTKVAGKNVGRIAGRIPIVGPLIDFGIRTLVFKEPLGKAAAGAVGAGVGQALGAWLGGTVGTVAGSVVPIVGNLLAGAAGATIGGLIGGLIGDQIGVSLYNVMMSSKPGKVQARSSGGKITQRTGRDPGKNVKRKKPKPVRIQKLKINKVSVGQSSGGRPIQDLYGTKDIRQKPLSTLVATSERLKRSGSSIMGKIMSLGVDYVLGQKPSKSTKKDIAKSFASLMSMISEYPDAAGADITKSFQALAGGGEVLRRDVKIRRKNEQMLGFMRGIEKSLDKDIGSLGSLAAIIRNGGGSPGPYDDGGGAPGARLRSGSNAQIEADLLEYFTAIYGKNAAIGIVANIKRESGYRTATPDNSRFEGMVQWSRNDRWPKFVKWAEEKGLDPYNRNVQAQYIAVDINKHGIAGELRSASSPEEAASIFYNRFERGAHSKAVKGNAYDPNNPHENLNKQFITEITGRNPNIGSRAGQVVVLPRPQTVSGNLKDTGLTDSSGRPIKLKGIIADAFIDMASAARKDGIDLGPGISNAFRDSEHNRRVGGAQGSRHLTGEAFDINWNSTAGRWIRNNASRFGFQYNTYSGESTHFDWVGGYTPQRTQPARPTTTASNNQNKGVVFRDGQFIKLGGGLLGSNQAVSVTNAQNTNLRATVKGFGLGTGKTEGETKQAADGSYYVWQGGKWISLYAGGNASLAPSSGGSRSQDIASLSQRPSYDDGVDRVLIVNLVDKVG